MTRTQTDIFFGNIREEEGKEKEEEQKQEEDIIEFDEIVLL